MSEKFQEFYSIYPRKVGKLDAEKAFKQMTARFDENAILEGAQKFAAQCRAEGKEPQFIPYPASWLRAGRWMDGEHETIKPVPLFRPATSVEEVRQFYEARGQASAHLKKQLANAKTLEDLPAFAKLIPVSWNVVQLKREA